MLLIYLSFKLLAFVSKWRCISSKCITDTDDGTFLSSQPINTVSGILGVLDFINDGLNGCGRDFPDKSPVFYFVISVIYEYTKEEHIHFNYDL